jgi:asparagine synthase (glutamine-hydrolysing)
MCGIFGTFQLSQANEDNMRQVSRAISHRGPDGLGIRSFRPGDFLGHLRLSILDLQDRSLQPMRFSTQKNKFSLCFNGEVYNYIELKKELEAEGYTFVTTSDTEVVLAAYDFWGKSAFQRFNGMWALALYDENKNTLLLCRDRFGVKPLYVWQNASEDSPSIVFASEIKGFLPLSKELNLKWNLQAVHTALTSMGTLEASGQTLLKNVVSLLPGELWEVSDTKIRKQFWWKTEEQLNLSRLSEKVENSSAFEEFHETFKDACNLRMRSDVPVGTSLSGGIDSSAVVSMLSTEAQNKGEKPNYSVFTHLFKDKTHPEIDESEFVESVLKRYHLSSETIELDENETLNIDKILHHFESIYPGIPDGAWRLYERQRKKGVYVSLDGHGADEYLAGYHDYAQLALLQALPNFSKARKLLKQLKLQTGSFFSWKRLFLTALKEIFFKTLPGFSTWVKKIESPVFRSIDTSSLPRPLLARPIEVPTKFDLLNRRLYVDFHRDVLPRILKNFDLMSMAHGVEVRMPFLDYRLIKLCFSLSSDFKIHSGYTKWILRKSLEKELPREIFERKLKIGFNSPMHSWLRGPLKNWVLQTLSEESCFDEFISREKLKKLYVEEILKKNSLTWNQLGHFWSTLSALRLSQLWKNEVSL